MVHFAKLNESNVVTQVIVIDHAPDPTWVRTYYATPGKNYAGLGWTYHADKENFAEPQPYPSWTLDDACRWQPPVPRPADTENALHTWNEETQSWDQISF